MSDIAVIVLSLLVALLFGGFIVMGVKYWQLLAASKERDSRPPPLSDKAISINGSQPQNNSARSGPYSALTHSGGRDRVYSALTDWTKGELLGRGGFAPVFMALDRQTGQIFATKQVEMIRDQKGRRLFKDKVNALRKEIQTLCKLHHVNIVQYLGTSRSKAHLYLHLEYVSGGSLADLISEFGSLSLRLTQNYTEQILIGLDFLHSKGLVHRDIKPSNILVSQDGCCKLADFGCAKYLEELKLRTSCTGTAVYMAPEAHQQQDVCAKADIWSLGCTVIEMANGHGPIWIEYSRYKMFLYISGKQFDPQIPMELEQDGVDFVAQCLQQTPHPRPDASTLLNHPFIVIKKEQMEYENQSLLQQQSCSSFSLFDGESNAGMPMMTRHISEESFASFRQLQDSQIDAAAIAKHIVCGPQEADDTATSHGSHGTEHEVRIDIPNPDTEDEEVSVSAMTAPTVHHNSVQVAHAKSMPISGGMEMINIGSGLRTSLRSRRQSVMSEPVRLSFSDVVEVVRIKAIRAKKKQMEWMAEEKMKAEQVKAEQEKVAGYGAWLLSQEQQWESPNIQRQSKIMTKNKKEEHKLLMENGLEREESGNSVEYDYNSE